METSNFKIQLFSSVLRAADNQYNWLYSTYWISTGCASLPLTINNGNKIAKIQPLKQQKNFNLNFHNNFTQQKYIMHIIIKNIKLQHNLFLIKKYCKNNWNLKQYQTIRKITCYEASFFRCILNIAIFDMLRHRRHCYIYDYFPTWPNIILSLQLWTMVGHAPNIKHVA